MSKISEPLREFSDDVLFMATDGDYLCLSTNYTALRWFTEDTERKLYLSDVEARKLRDFLVKNLID